MTQAVRDFERTFEAENDLSTKQYTIVELGAADNQVDTCDAQGEKSVGVLQNDPGAGEAALVRFLGTTKVKAGAAITKGAFITTGAAGKAEAALTGDYIIGRALEAAAADGDIIEMQLMITGVPLA